LIAEQGRRGLFDRLRKALPMDIQYGDLSSLAPLPRRFAGWASPTASRNPWPATPTRSCTSFATPASPCWPF